MMAASPHPGRVQREPIWSGTSARGPGYNADRSWTATAGITRSLGAVIWPDGLARARPMRAGGGTGRQPPRRTPTSSAGWAIGLRPTGAVSLSQQIRAVPPETGALPAPRGPTRLAARPDQTRRGPSTVVVYCPPGPTGAGPAQIRMTAAAPMATGLAVGASPAATMTGPGLRRAPASMAWRSRQVRCPRGSGRPRRRRDGSLRERGPAPSARPGSSRPAACCRVSCGPTSTGGRPGCPVTGTQAPGATPSGARRKASGRVSRQQVRPAPGRGRTNREGGAMLAAPGCHPTGGTGRRRRPPSGELCLRRRTGLCLRRPTGLCLPRPTGPFLGQAGSLCLRRPTGLCLGQAGRLCLPAGLGRPALSCAPCLRLSPARPDRNWGGPTRRGRLRLGRRSPRPAGAPGL